MGGKQRKLLIIVEDRGARGGAVIGKAEALGHFLMHTGPALQIWVFGADEGDRGHVDTGRIGIRDRIDGAEFMARKVGDFADRAVADIGHDLAQQGFCGALLIPIEIEHVEIPA